MGIDFTLLSRSYCHLCHDMELAVVPVAAEFNVSVTIVDVDANPALVAKYDERVPVLLHGETELCHYFLDEAKIREYLVDIR